MTNRIENWTGVPFFVILSSGGRAHMTRDAAGPYYRTYCGRMGMSKDATVVTDPQLDVCGGCERVAESLEGNL